MHCALKLKKFPVIRVILAVMMFVALLVPVAGGETSREIVFNKNGLRCTIVFDDRAVEENKYCLIDRVFVPVENGRKVISSFRTESNPNKGSLSGGYQSSILFNVLLVREGKINGAAVYGKRISGDFDYFKEVLGDGYLNGDGIISIWIGYRIDLKL